MNDTRKFVVAKKRDEVFPQVLLRTTPKYRSNLGKPVPNCYFKLIKILSTLGVPGDAAILFAEILWRAGEDLDHSFCTRKSGFFNAKSRYWFHRRIKDLERCGLLIRLMMDVRTSTYRWAFRPWEDLVDHVKSYWTEQELKRKRKPAVRKIDADPGPLKFPAGDAG